VTFRYKNYRCAGADRQQSMTLAADEFIRRFLLHVLPKGFHRIRHYGLLAGATRKGHLDRVRQLLGVAPPAVSDAPTEPDDARPPCPCCGGNMVIIETFERWQQPRAPPHGTSPRDPAWLVLTALRKSRASGDDAARAGDPADRSGDHLKPGSGRTFPVQPPLRTTSRPADARTASRSARNSTRQKPKSP
jgi:hypothetical protein